MKAKQGHWITAAAFCMMHYRRSVRPCGMRELKEEKRRIMLREQFINPDHVHLFITAHPKWAPSQLVKIFKGVTAKFLFET